MMMPGPPDQRLVRTEFDAEQLIGRCIELELAVLADELPMIRDPWASRSCPISGSR